MVERQKIKLVIFSICIIFFLPFLFKPDILTAKDNDLGRNYVPIFSFLKSSFHQYQQIPMWRGDQLMGESVIGNPVSSLAYPLNILFLITSVDLASILYLLIHFLLAGIFTYHLARSYNLSQIASISAALFYSFSTKFMLHFSAGHVTMIAAFAYFPLAFLALRKTLIKPSPIWVVAEAVSLVMMYVTYPTIAYYGAIFLVFYSAYYLFSRTRKRLSIFIFFILSLLIALGACAIVLLPHIEFSNLSTRTQLTLEDVALPLWNFKRFITSLSFPYINFGDFDHESFLYLGTVPTALFFLGFFRLSTAKKVFFVIVGFLTLMFVAGLSTPLFQFAYDFLPALKYSRITTRLWFVVALVVALMAAFGIEKIKNKKIIYFLIIAFLAESFFIGYQKIINTKDLKFENESLYQFLKKDEDIFRVYCTSHCFNPQLLSRYKIQILNGENPIQQASFIEFLAKAGNYDHDEFAVIFPPYPVWQTENPPIPSSHLLGVANVKYVASTYELKTKDFIFLDKFQEIYLYKNLNFKPRAYFENSNDIAKIQELTPNRLTIVFEKALVPRNLIVSENFYPGWFAYINNQKFQVDQNHVFRKVTIPPNTSQVELKYQPESFLIGKTITVFTILVTLMYFWYIRNKKLHD